ncbi:M18 family aminopeptidase [Anaeromicropila herbilytica]|uniref:M18 family aminopeptidase n=1 Tax=Anaeromicropila herbilytica TaxID=2785025 RepID=A0A7R7EKA5_9FIRM|nr:M18 family aminopeptidase [Anaeromicropila herbilytica]BCN30260.1 M18 family aminopeptidase [Anaeromicropila herbilytica]
MKFIENAKELVDFINRAPSAYHVVSEGIATLKEQNYKELDLTKDWNLTPGERYYITSYPTALFAFEIGKGFKKEDDFRIVSAHTDHPCLKIKPVACMAQGNYLKVNTEVYGGPILNTWLDRPLSIAGKVALKSNNVFEPEIRIIDFKKPVLTIPNLAIHMNRDVNKGVELNKQIDMIPIAAMVSESLNKEDFFYKKLASLLEVQAEDILDFDLQVYAYEKGELIGFEEDFISAPRIDNISSCFGALQALKKNHREYGINVIALFDNEEIGSRSKQGADSNLLTIILEKICAGLGMSHIEFYQMIMKSMMLSADVAHGLHPNHPEKNDPTNITTLNEGVVLKINSNQKYATDSKAIGIVQQLCDKHEIKYQKFVNKSDIAGGGTLGSLVSSLLPMLTVDFGVPMLAMHSARELMGSKDQYYMEALMGAFFAE